MDFDWLDQDQYEAALREGGPLEIVRRPVDITGFEDIAGPPPALRLEYATAGTATGPNVGLAEVVVIEEAGLVSVAVCERITWGVRPGGFEVSEKLAKVYGFVEVPLHRPLGDRGVIDGANGRQVPRLTLDDPNPRTRYGPLGCPRWIP